VKRLLKLPGALGARQTTGTGRRAEALAASFLEGRGLRIVARNWRPPRPEDQPAPPDAEIDLVADDQGTCVFVEVRARTGLDFGHPLEAVSAWKRGRVIRAARLYLASESPRARGFRFDVVGVLFAPAGGEPQLFHVPNAFEVDY
jgi:putative endonuclease